MVRNAVADILKLVPPPADPVDTDPAYLAANEERLGIRFPKDFTEFGRLYGSGRLLHPELRVRSPCRPSYPDFVAEFVDIFGGLRESLALWAAKVSLDMSLFPEPGGLLPFASNSQGTWICWRMIGNTDEWTVVDMEGFKSGQYEKYDMGATDYLHQVMSRQLLLGRLRNQVWDPRTELSYQAEFLLYP